jgi:hypothetical protein
MSECESQILKNQDSPLGNILYFLGMSSTHFEQTIRGWGMKNTKTARHGTGVYKKLLTMIC